jgi:hypothetical protein
MNESLLRVLIDGAILSIGLSIVLIGTLYFNPRLFLHDYPKEIQAKVPPLTLCEKRDRWIVFVLFIGVTVGALAYSMTGLRAAYGGTCPS